MNLLHLKLKYAEVLPYTDTECTMQKMSVVDKSRKFVMHPNILMQRNLYSSFLEEPCAETDNRRLTVAGQH